jgi:hypothetical protein
VSRRFRSGAAGSNLASSAFVPRVTVRTPFGCGERRAGCEGPGPWLRLLRVDARSPIPLGTGWFRPSKLTAGRGLDAHATLIRPPVCYVVGCRQEELAFDLRSVGVVGGACSALKCACATADRGIVHTGRRGAFASTRERAVRAAVSHVCHCDRQSVDAVAARTDRKIAPQGAAGGLRVGPAVSERPVSRRAQLRGPRFRRRFR